MNLSPRALAFRLALWTGLFAWAVWKLNASDLEAASAPARRELSRPGPAPALVGAPPTVVDPEGLARALDGARAAVRACGVSAGRLQVSVGPDGLGTAALEATATEAQTTCVAAAVWGLDWPRTALEVETEVALGG